MRTRFFKREVPMKNQQSSPFPFIALCLVAVLVVGGCSASDGTTSQGFKYRYTYAMVEPTRDTSLSYRDANLRFRFAIDDAAVIVQIENRSKSYVIVDLPRARVGVDGKLTTIRHRDSYLAGSAKPVAKLLAPGEIIEDFIMPQNNLTIEGKEYHETDLFPTVDLRSASRRKQILESRGRTLSLVLPVEIGGAKVEYSFKFAVANVNRILWKHHHPPQRVPEEPIKKPVASKSDVITGAIITAGVLGFAAVILTAKKDPRTD
jgi:hypothetical protein